MPTPDYVPPDDVAPPEPEAPQAESSPGDGSLSEEPSDYLPADAAASPAEEPAPPPELSAVSPDYVPVEPGAEAPQPEPAAPPLSDEEQREHNEVEEIARSALFDLPWYLAEYPDIRQGGLDPLTHFCRHGRAEGRWPNPWFDTEYYLEQSWDVRNIGLNPLLHYLRHGEAEGRKPHPHFDPIWYRALTGLPAEASALRHFLDHRLECVSAPSPALFAVMFLPAYRRHASLRVDPFLRFLADRGGGHATSLPEQDLIAPSGLLDLNYYLINGSDVHEAQLDPAAHFCRFGWKEMRNPNIYFNTKWYLTTNPDVARLQLNPLVHYLCIGEPAGRRPVVYFDPAWYRATYGIAADQSSLAHFLAHRRSQKYSPIADFDVDWYVQTYRQLVGGNRDPFAHYLQTGTYRDLSPSPAFDAALYRRTHLGRPSRHFRNRMHPDQDNPLIHYLHTLYT